VLPEGWLPPYEGRLPPDMCVHLCVVDEPGLPDGDADGDVFVDTDVVEDVVCARAVAAEPVDALAMVRPRPRLTPRTPAPMAVPMSGRVILTMISLPN
jgi:hypothetical protein